MKILYIGGTGEISFDCIHETVKAGHEVTVFNRGNNNKGLPESVHFVTGDFNDDNQYAQILAHDFDVICQFRVFTPEQMKRDLEMLQGKKLQYIFISTASAYHRPVKDFPITEKTPLHNPFSDYSSQKIDCEKLLQAQTSLRYTIIRPSHTSRTMSTTAMTENYYAASRILRDKPVIVPGDGTSLWTITAAEEFAVPFTRLIGNPQAIGDFFHITSDNYYTWNEIYTAIGRALGKETRLVHVPSDTLIKYCPAWKTPLHGDKTHTAVFDNSKIKKVVGDFTCKITLDEFMVRRATLYRDSGRVDQAIDTKQEALFDRIIREQNALGG